MVVLPCPVGDESLAQGAWKIVPNRSALVPVFMELLEKRPDYISVIAADYLGKLATDAADAIS
ncbi:MAG: hypothetical protein CMO80_10205 [Verrucomicrobiales bacterium]|nr:hypothetical protein [Verrucomicrobiales bacterium]